MDNTQNPGNKVQLLNDVSRPHGRPRVAGGAGRALICILLLWGVAARAQTDTLSGRIDRLDAAVVVSGTAERLVKPQTGLETLDAGIVRQVPALMGERDLLKVIQLLPGVQAPSEGASGFSVRGGQVDQNLILLDGAPLYSPGHLFGFVSMFNDDILGRTELYKGDFPARFGGRLSSVLDVSTRAGNLERPSGDVTLGLVASKIHLEGPILRDRLSYNISARRSLVDMVIPFIPQIPGHSSLRFYDVNAKLDWEASGRDRLSLNAFVGGDGIGGSMDQFGLKRMDFDYSNKAVSLKWRHAFSPSLHADVTLYRSRYSYDLGANYNYAIFNFMTSVRETGLRAGLIWQLGAKNTLEAGFHFPFVRIDSGDCVPRPGNLTMSEMHIPPSYAIQPNLYLEHEAGLGPLTLRYGLRLSGYTSLERVGWKPVQTYRGLEPRASLSARLGPAASLKAAYTRSSQYFQQALVSTTGSPLDVWIPASAVVKPQISDQYTLGYYQTFSQHAVEASLELFCKNNRNTADFMENVGFIIDQPDREIYLRFGRSYAYGAELMVRCNLGKWSGWLGYTYSKATFVIPEINGGKPYASPVNHEHSIDFFVAYEISPRLTASATWTYASGAPTTYPVARYALGGSYAPIFGARNEGRLPDYHRLDLSLVLRARKGEWNFSLYNAYSRHNVWSVTYSYSQAGDQPRASKVYLFPILPSISYSIHFQ